MSTIEILPLFMRLPWSAIGRAAATAWRKHREARLAHIEFAQLDAASRRDLGLDASEYLSYCAEADSLVETTRRRLAAM